MMGDAPCGGARAARAHRRPRRGRRDRDCRTSRTRCGSRRLHARSAGHRPCSRASASPRRRTGGRCRPSRAASSCACCSRRCSSAGPTSLFLDEPTNHLDILSIRWLEKFLAAYRGARGRHLARPALPRQRRDAHPRRRLPDDHPVHGQLRARSSWRRRRGARAHRGRGRAGREDRSPTSARSSSASAPRPPRRKQAQSRLKQIERIEVAELKASSRRAPLFRFTPERASGRDVLEVEAVSKAYGDEGACCGTCRWPCGAARRSRIIGPNGLGKSTLLKIVDGRLDGGRGQGPLRARGPRRVLRPGPPRAAATRR